MTPRLGRAPVRAGRCRGGDRRAARARPRHSPDAPPRGGARGRGRSARTEDAHASRGGRIGGGRLPDAVELAAYFLVSEALTNVVKHASASEATVRLERRRDLWYGGRRRDRRRSRPQPTPAWRASATGWRRWTRSWPSRASPAAARSQRRDPMRIVIADDAALVREGVARLLTRTGSRSSTRSATPMRSSGAFATNGPTWPSSTSACPRPTRTKGSAHAGDPLAVPGDGSARALAAPRARVRAAARGGRPEAVGYLMKERVGRVQQLLDALQRVEPVNASSTKRSSTSCSPGAAGSIPSPSSRRVSGRSSP